jgi:GTP:adenosylcobinamide-phosphate guanylyltransferase
VILAGGRAEDALAQRAGTPLRALFPYQGSTFIERVFQAVRASERVKRIAVIGPPELRRIPGLSAADLLLEERDSITANLFYALEALQPEGKALVTASDNPLLNTPAFDDFLRRAPAEAAVAYPILPHAKFLEEFPGASNVPISLRDGAWIGGGCILIEGRAVPHLRRVVEQVLASRKSKWKMARLLGPLFVVRFALRLLTVEQVEARAVQVSGLEFRFVRDCAPQFPIDIDDTTDWDYLQDWTRRHLGAEDAPFDSEK